MTKNEIITELYNSKPFNECIQRMEPQHLRQDLKQETILSLLEQPDQRIIELRKRNELVFFAAQALVHLKFTQMRRNNSAHN